MSRKLARFPSLAAYIGLTSVSNCDEAITYACGYDKYSERNPGFEEQPDPKWSSGPPAVDDRAILPRIKVKNGSKTLDWAFPTSTHPDSSPGPVVKIMHVVWSGNGKDVTFKKTMKDGTQSKRGVDQFCEPYAFCTATFINRSWLLTAAHCMQDVNKASIRTNPGALGTDGKTLVNPYCLVPAVPGVSDAQQPFLDFTDQHTPREGVASYVISWPVTGDDPTDDVPGSVSKQSTEAYYGVDLYQYPHEKYDPTQGNNKNNPEDNGTPIRRGPDVALLSMAGWLQAAEYMTPDLDNEGAMYIAGGSEWGPSVDKTLFVAGYGYNPADNTLALYGGALNGAVSPRLVEFYPGWLDDKPLTEFGFGGFGIVSSDVTSDDQVVTCSGDSGGPLYYVFYPEGGGTRKFIQYAVTSGHRNAPGVDDHCALVGGTSYWSRIEADDRMIEWMYN
jgi:hypothetical protein